MSSTRFLIDLFLMKIVVHICIQAVVTFFSRSESIKYCNLSLFQVSVAFMVELPATALLFQVKFQVLKINLFIGKFFYDFYNEISEIIILPHIQMHFLQYS